MVNKRSLILVGVQFICLGLMAITGPVIPDGLTLWIMYLSGFGLGVWAVYVVFRHSKLRISPELAEDGKLITGGPYKLIRHPMYTGVLLICFCLIVSYPSVFRYLIFLILAADLAVKMNYEEKLLTKRFGEYEKYQRSTKKLIPYIY